MVSFDPPKPDDVDSRRRRRNALANIFDGLKDADVNLLMVQSADAVTMRNMPRLDIHLDDESTDSAPVEDLIEDAKDVAYWVTGVVHWP